MEYIQTILVIMREQVLLFQIQVTLNQLYYFKFLLMELLCHNIKEYQYI